MPHTSVTFKDVQTLMERRWNNQPFWTSEEARLHFNEALREWNLYTATWRQRITATTTQNAHIHAIPSGLLTYVTTIRYLDRRALHRDSRIALGDLRPNWRGERTDSGGSVPIEPRRWFPYGLTKFGIWPADHVGGNLLLLDGIAVTPQLTALGQSVDISDTELPLLIGEALHLASFKSGAGVMQQLIKHHQLFLAAAFDRNDRLGASVKFRRAAGLDTSMMERPARQYPRAAQKLQGATGGNQ